MGFLMFRIRVSVLLLLTHITLYQQSTSGGNQPEKVGGSPTKACFLHQGGGEAPPPFRGGGKRLRQAVVNVLSSTALCTMQTRSSPKPVRVTRMRYNQSWRDHKAL